MDDLSAIKNRQIVTDAPDNEAFLFEEKHILELIASGQPLRKCLEAITESIFRLEPGIRAGILTANPDRTAIAECFSAHLPSSFSENIAGAPINNIRIGTCGTAMYAGIPVVCTDIANGEGWSQEWKDLCLSHGVQACHSAPVFDSRGNAIASLFLCLAQPRSLNRWEQRIAEFGARVTGMVIQRDRVYNELHRSRGLLEAELADAKLLQRLSMELVQEDGNDGLYKKIVKAASIIMRSQYASMQMLYPEPDSIGKLRLLAASGFSPEAEKFWEWVYPGTGSSCGAALLARTRVIVPNFVTNEFMQDKPTLSLFLESGIYAAQSTPLYSRSGKLLGMISTHWNYPHQPLERELNLLDILARQAADLIERNQTAEALRQSEERLRALTTATSDVIYRMSPDWKEMYHLDGQNVLHDAGGPISDWLQKYIPSNDQEYVMAAILDAVRSKRPFQLEHRVIKADGTIGWTFSRAVPILDPEGNIVEWFGAASDVSERKRAEEALQVARDESEKRKRLYEAITGGTPDLIYVFDLDYRFTYANEALLKMWGRTWDESIGKHLKDLGYEPWHAEMHEREIDYVIKNKEPIRGEVSFPHAALGRRMYDYILVPVLNGEREVEAVAGTTRDITDLKLAEEALKESEAKFRRFYESNMLPIAFWTVHGNVYECNGAFARLVGYTREEVVSGKFSWKKNTAPEYRHLHSEGVTRAIEQQVFIEPYEVDVVRKDGKRITVMVGYTMLEGSTEKGVAFLLDISDLKSLMTELEKRVEERTRELQRSNEDLQQFAHVASHDLKEPVRKIKTFGNLLKGQLNSGNIHEGSKAFLDKILSAAERMSTMIEGVLTYSMFNAAEQKIEKLNLNQIISDITNDLEVVIHQKGAVIHCGTLPQVEGVQVLMYQLFYNLINNSLKFSKRDESAVIEITGHTVLVDGVNYANITVTDNGIGFEPVHSEMIFDTFTRLNSKDKFDGTGLGLSLCKKIVERHHGTIEANGQPNDGAVFNITIPLKQLR